jgi:chromosome segregation ATPase
MITIHVDQAHVYHDGNHLDVLDAIARLSTQISRLRGASMAKFEDVQTALAEIDTVTTQMSEDVDQALANDAEQIAEIQKLKDQIAAGTPVTQEQLDSVAASLTAKSESLKGVSAKLKGLAVDPENPIPEAA